VVIFGSTSFDVANIALNTVDLSGARPKLLGSEEVWTKAQDVDSDSHMDLILEFKTSETNPTPDGRLILEGKTLDGTTFRGFIDIGSHPGNGVETETLDPSKVSSRQELGRTAGLQVEAEQSSLDGSIHLRFVTPNRGDVQVRLYDVKGRVLFGHQLRSAGSVIQEVTLTRTLHLHPGVYFVQLRQEGVLGRGKLLVY